MTSDDGLAGLLPETTFVRKDVILSLTYDLRL